MSAASAMAWSGKQIAEWQIANRKPVVVQRVGGTSLRNEFKWQSPEVGCLKINVDATVVNGQNSFAVGMVIRNHQGHYIAGKTMRFVGSVSVMEAELTCIVEALSWAQEVAEGRVMIESDSLLSVHAIEQGQEYLLELGDIVHQCKDILRCNDRFSVKFVRKQANKVAHSMARIPCELNSFFVTPSPPNFLLETLLSDILVI